MVTVKRLHAAALPPSPAPLSKQKPAHTAFKTVALVTMTLSMCLVVTILLYIGYWMERLESAPFMMAADSAMQAAATFICEAALKAPSMLACTKSHFHNIASRFRAGISTAASAATILLWSASIAKQNLDDTLDVGSDGLVIILTLMSTWAETSTSTWRHHCKANAFQLQFLQHLSARMTSSSSAFTHQRVADLRCYGKALCQSWSAARHASFHTASSCLTWAETSSFHLRRCSIAIGHQCSSAKQQAAQMSDSVSSVCSAWRCSSTVAATQGVQSVKLLPQVVVRHCICWVKDAEAALGALYNNTAMQVSISAVIINELIWQMVDPLVDMCLMVLLIISIAIMSVAAYKACHCCFAHSKSQLMAAYLLIDLPWNVRISAQDIFMLL